MKSLLIGITASSILTIPSAKEKKITVNALFIDVCVKIVDF